MRFLSTIKKRAEEGFTLIEVLIIAPVVIIVISGFIGLIVVMVGDVLAVRDRNNMAYEIRNTLDRIEQDTRISTQFLTTSSTLQSPQGSDNNFAGTAAFTNTNSLILGNLTTDKNPTDSTRQLIYYAKQPNECASALLSYNRPFIGKTIYFIKNGSLWRRVYLLPHNTTAPANDETVCTTPWQQNSCNPGYAPATRCQTNDTELMQNLSSMNVKYYATPQSTVDLGAANALNATSIEVTLNGSKTIAGRNVTNTGTVRINKLNSIDADLPIPTTPAVTATASGTANTVSFSWDAVPAATSYLISYNINGGAWVDATNDSFTTNYVVSAYRNDTVTMRVSAKNSSGTSPYGQTAATVPAWNTCQPQLQANWQNYESTYATAGFTKTSTSVVAMKGLIRTGTASAGTVICNLPVGFRPTARLIFLTSTAGGTEGAPARIDVATNGDVILDYGVNNGWLSLDAIRFVASTAPYTWTDVPRENGWNNYGGIWSEMEAINDSIGRVHLQGLIKDGNYADWTIAARLPNAQRPSHFMNFPAASNTAFNQYGLANGGTYGAVTARGTNGAGYWGIQGIYYPYTFTTGWSNLTPLATNWVAFDAANYSPPSYRKASDGLVTVRGLIRNTATSGAVGATTLATLPVGYRPAERQIYTCVSNGAWSRVDVLPNGSIEMRLGYGGYVSLDSITFLAEQ